MSYTKDYYRILGVTPSAEDIVIRAAYKALVQRYHPDRYQGDPAEATRIVQELVEAYSILSDPEKRTKYDVWLRQKKRQNENKPEDNYAAEDKPEVHEAGASKDPSSAPDTGAIEAYIGTRNKDYYLSIFKDFDSKGVGLHRSWNWATFLGGPAWLLYRKMYGFFFLFSATLVASFILVNTGRAAFGNLIHFFPLYIFAHYANFFYYRQVTRKVLSAKLAKGDIGSQLGRLRREGGVHSWVIWASGGLVALFIVTALIDSANSPMASNPSQMAAPSPDATADAPPAAPKSFAIAKPAAVPVAAAPPSLDDALAAYDGGDYGAAAQTLRLLAEQGDAEAQSNLGGMYYLGQGVPQDYVQAAKWFRLAAEHGRAAAQRTLGLMYDNGQGVLQDYVQAVKWYRLAAEQGDAAAQKNLGFMYAEGHGVPQDDVQAVNWCRRAAEQGDAVAQRTLGFMYEKGQGVPQDDVQAAKWYRLAAEQGDALTQKILAFMYEKGRGVPQDYVQAVKWYRRAAEQGDAVAQNNLGGMYDLGHGVPQDYVQAVKWFSLAAEQGDAAAQKNLGFMYAEGHGVPQDDVQAVKWYNLAVSRYTPSEAEWREMAVKNRDQVAARMTPTQVAEAQRLAREWTPKSEGLEQ